MGISTSMDLSKILINVLVLVIVIFLTGGLYHLYRRYIENHKGQG